MRVFAEFAVSGFGEQVRLVNGTPLLQDLEILQSKALTVIFFRDEQNFMC